MKNRNAITQLKLGALAAAVSIGLMQPAFADQHDKMKAHSPHHTADLTQGQWVDLFESRLAMKVQSKLSESASLRGTNITVEANEDGEITLEGTVRTEAQQQRAERIAASVPGVYGVDSDLDVDGDMNPWDIEELEDEMLAKKVAQKIAQTMGGNAEAEESWLFGWEVEGETADGDEWEVEVDADDGEIELNGDLPTNADVSRVLQATRSIPAVRSIENDLESEEDEFITFESASFSFDGYGMREDQTYISNRATLVGDNGETIELVCRFADEANLSADAEN